MKRVINILLLLCLSACQTENEVITPPTHEELGRICTLVTTFDEEMVNVSIYYTSNESYPIQNEEELFEVNDMIIKYSSSGLKNVNEFPVNKEKSLRQCEMTDNANTIELATQISSNDFQNFIQDLNDFQFHYEIEKENKTFQVAMPNHVYVYNSMILNNERVYALDFTEEELESLENIELTKQYQVTFKGREGIVASTVKDHILKDGTQVLNQSNQLVGVGEGYQIYISVAIHEELGVDYYPLMTLVKFDKNDIREDTYIQLDTILSLSDLDEYQLYETKDYIVYDLNDYFYKDEIDRNDVQEVYEDLLGSIDKLLGD